MDYEPLQNPESNHEQFILPPNNASEPALVSGIPRFPRNPRNYLTRGSIPDQCDCPNVLLPSGFINNQPVCKCGTLVQRQLRLNSNFSGPKFDDNCVTLIQMMNHVAGQLPRNPIRFPVVPRCPVCHHQLQRPLYTQRHLFYTTPSDPPQLTPPITKSMSLTNHIYKSK